MKVFLIPLASALALVPAAPAADSNDAPKPVAQLADNAVEARRIALDLAGAFSNDGFKLRDGHWIGELKQGSPALLQVNLYAGNEYWFSAASASHEGAFSVSLLDEKGAPIEFEPFAEPGRGAAGFSPEISGPYYLKLVWKGAAPTPVCVVYSYK
jgi:hypothetical protein